MNDEAREKVQQVLDILCDVQGLAGLVEAVADETDEATAHAAHDGGALAEAIKTA